MVVKVVKFNAHITAENILKIIVSTLCKFLLYDRHENVVRKWVPSIKFDLVHWCGKLWIFFISNFIRGPSNMPAFNFSMLIPGEFTLLSTQSKVRLGLTPSQIVSQVPTWYAIGENLILSLATKDSLITLWFP